MWYYIILTWLVCSLASFLGIAYLSRFLGLPLGTWEKKFAMEAIVHCTYWPVICFWFLLELWIKEANTVIPALVKERSFRKEADSE